MTIVLAWPNPSGLFILSNSMPDDFEPITAQSTDTPIKGVMEWLALAYGRTGLDDVAELHDQFTALRDTTIPSGQRIKVLDLLFKHLERVVLAEKLNLQQAGLPISRQLRLDVITLQELLETAIREYFHTLADVLDPPAKPSAKTRQKLLHLLLRCIGWHIRISHLAGAPVTPGIWQKLHATYRTARRLGVAELPLPGGKASIQQAYIHILLVAIAQPASFCPSEIQFIADYIAATVTSLDILEIPPLDRDGIFWIDLEQDYPAQALRRRQPSGDVLALYFACDLVARDTCGRLAALAEGAKAINLGLPAYADTPAGRGVLRRLGQLWGQPAKRQHPRRRQSYRINLCAGLEELWQLIRVPETQNQRSEWMVVNEGPDGYALMHMSGQTTNLRVGDVVALQPIHEKSDSPPSWNVGIVRWALSENPEHIEIGVEQLSAQAIAAEVVPVPVSAAGKLTALILPAVPPAREKQALITATGQLAEKEGRLLVLIEQGNFGIHELRPVALTEQTARIEVFTVEPDGKS